MRVGRILAVLLFIIYLAGLSYFLFFSSMLGRDTGEGVFYLEGLPLYGTLNLEPLRVIRIFITNFSKIPFPIFFLNIFGNIICFMPFGFLLPAATGGKLHFISTVILGALCSAGFEALQYFTGVGAGDVDDIILNTIGTAIGYIIGARAVRKILITG